MDRRVRTVTIFATGAKVLVKSVPFFCVLPSITSLALKLLIDLSALCLILYTYLLPRSRFPGSKDVSLRVLFCP